MSTNAMTQDKLRKIIEDAKEEQRISDAELLERTAAPMLCDFTIGYESPYRVGNLLRSLGQDVRFNHAPPTYSAEERFRRDMQRLAERDMRGGEVAKS